MESKETIEDPGGSEELDPPSPRKHFDDIIAETGGFGLYQIVVSCGYSIPRMVTGFLVMSIVFSYDVPDHRCAVPTVPNDTYTVTTESHRSAVDSVVPPLGRHHQCYIYNNSTNASIYNQPDILTSYERVNLTLLQNVTYEKCNRWVFDNKDFSNTIVTDFNIVCDKRLTASHAKMLFFAGNLAGSVILGAISDTYGRLLAIRISVLLVIISTLCISFSTHHYVIMAMFPVAGAGSVGQLLASIVAVMEILPANKRSRPGSLFSINSALGFHFAILIVYISRTWWISYLVIASCSFLYLIITLLIPEPGRWLLSKGRLKQAEHEVRRMARYNGVSLRSSFSLDHVVFEKKERTDVFYLVRSPKLIGHAAVICLNMFTNGLVLFGLSINTVHMVGNIFINAFILHLGDIAACFVVYYGLDRWGRVHFHCVTMIGGGVTLLMSMVPVFLGGTNFQPLIISLALIGKLAIACTFRSAYIMAIEVFPTNVRSTAMGVASTCARCGAMISPYLTDMSVIIDPKYGQALPMTMFGSFAVASGLLALLLPETTNKRLPDTVHDFEMSDRKSEPRQPKHSQGAETPLTTTERL